MAHSGQSTIHANEALYLLHCNTTGEYGIKLRQDLISENLNDQELFKFIRMVYYRARRKTRWFTIRNTRKMSLSKVITPSTIRG